MKSWGSAVIVASVTAGCAVPLAEDLSETDAATQAAVLETAGISVMREEVGPGRVRLLVRSDDVARAFSATSQQRPPAGAVIPTERQAHAAVEDARARDVERLLRGLPGVTWATVSLSLPFRDPLSADAPAPPRAAVVVRAATSLPGDRITTVVLGAVDGLVRENITVDVARAAPAAAPAALSLVGPFVVTTRSAGPLRATLAALLGSMAIASSLFAWSRLRRLA